MATLKRVANVIYVLGLLGSLAVLAYFTALGLGLTVMPNGFWS
jgi:hypothetical protein